MASDDTLLELTKITSEDWAQPLSEALRVTECQGCAVLATVTDLTWQAGDPTVVWIQTAVDNADGRHVNLAKVAEISAGTITMDVKVVLKP